MTIAAVFFAAALSAGNAEFDKVAAEGAARITMDRFAADLAGKGAGVSLSDAMLADPAKHSARTKSESICREMWTKAALDAYVKESENVRRRLNLPKEYALEMAKGVRSALDAKFPRAFDLERKRAVAAQSRTLVTSLRPSEAEFESMKEDDLRRIMTERVVAERKGSLFEENREVVTTALVDPMLSAGKAERNRQIEYVKRVKSDAFAPSRIAADLSAKLEADVEERSKKAGPAEAWGVFPSVKEKEIPKDVERRVEARLVAGIGDVALSIKADEVKSVIESDPAAHVKFRASERLFAQRYRTQVLEAATAAMLSAAPEKERAELKEALGRLSESEKAKKAVEKVVRRDAMPHWKTAREALAKAIAVRTWPKLANGTWYPNAKLADETVARSDYDRAVKKWRKMPGMDALAKAGGERPLMEETEAEADSRVAAAFDLARSAISAQSAIVDDVAPGVLADSCERKASFFRRTPTLADITRRLEAATRERWGASRRSTLWPNGGEPANADKQHAALFPSVKRKVELVARQILEEMEEPPKPEEEFEIFALSVQRNGKDVKVELRRGSDTLSSESVPAKDAAFRKAMERATRKLSADVLKLPQ